MKLKCVTLSKLNQDKMRGKISEIPILILGRGTVHVSQSTWEDKM